jgi:oligosaccharyltransferase complex subunit beta
VVGDVQESAAVLRKNGDSIDHIAFFATGVKRACIVSSLLEVSGRLLTSTCAELPAELSPQSLARRLESGVDLLLVVPPPATEVWRDFAREFEVDFDDRESWVADHVAYNRDLDSGSHTVLTVPVNDAPSPFISAATRAGPPVIYHGGGHAAGPHPLLTTLLRASPSAISAAAGSEGPPEGARMIGSQHALVSAFQARNNARVAFSGSVDFFSDEYLESPEVEKPKCAPLLLLLGERPED